MTYNSRRTSVVISTDLSSKEPLRQVGMDRVVTSGRLGGIMATMLARNTRDVCSNPAVGAVYPVLITPMTVVKAN